MLVWVEMMVAPKEAVQLTATRAVIANQTVSLGCACRMGEQICLHLQA